MERINDSNVVAASAVDADELWHATGPSALRLATVLVGSDAAHDVAVAAFLRTVARAGRTPVEQVGRYWLRAVSNEAHDLHRSDQRRRRRDLVAVPPAGTTDVPADVDLRRAIARLTLRQRTILYLAYWEDLTEPATAAVLGISRGTVNRELRRARDRLRKELT